MVLVRSSLYLTRESNGRAATARFDRYQNFESDSNGDVITILHTPDFHVDAIDQPLGKLPVLWGGEASATALQRSEPGFQTSGLVPRLDLFPHLSLPLAGPYGAPHHAQPDRGSQ